MTIIPLPEENRGVRRIEFLPKTHNGWTYFLAIFDEFVDLIRFKDKKFQVIERNENLKLNPNFIYSLSAKTEFITISKTNHLLVVPRRLLLTNSASIQITDQ